MDEARAAPHAFVMGSSTTIAPVTRWDAAEINGGRPTLAVSQLVALLDKDRDPLTCGDPAMHTEVPFAILGGQTGRLSGL